MSVKVISIKAYVFGINVNVPIPCQLPLGISGKEIINLLIYKYNAQIKEDFILIAKLPSKNYTSYRIIESKTDFSKCSENKDASLLAYPPKICLTVKSPDGRSIFREYDAKKSVGDIIASLCHSSFKLQTHLAYALYLKKKDCYVPMSNIKAIIECDPFITEVYLRRYFWLRPFIKINRESDVNFIYGQAREIVNDPKFSYKNYRFIDLIAIDLIIKYETYEKAKKIMKKAKKKEIFPKYIYDSRKKVKNTVKQMKNYDGKPPLELKKTFIALCVQYQFFGIPIYAVKSNLPDNPKSSIKEYFLTIDSEFLYLLERKAHIIMYKVEIARVQKYQIQKTNVLFVIVEKQRKPDGSRNVTKWPVSFVNPLPFTQFFTNLIHFIKHENLQNQKKKDHKHHKHRKRRNSTLTRSMSVSAFQTSSFNFIDRDDLDLTDVDFHPTLELSSSLKRLNPIDPPEQQKIVDCDVELASVTSADAVTDDSYIDNLISCIPESELQFDYSYPTESENEKELTLKQSECEEDITEKDEVLPPEVYLIDACNLIKKTVNEDALISETIVFIQSYLPRSQFKQTVIGWQLQCASDSSYQRISCVSRAIIYFLYMNNTIAPLDLFATINYIHSILLIHGRSQWSKIDFIEIAKKIDYQLGLVAENYLSLSKRVSHPIASILLDCSLRITNEYQDLYLFTQTIYFALFVTCVSVAKAFCNAGIASNMLQPILNTLPDVLEFDMGRMIELAEPLYQISHSLEKNEETQKKFFSQTHFSNPQFKSIISIINDIHNSSLIVQTPAFAFFSSFSYTLNTLPENLTQTIVEAGDIYSRAKHCSVVYWNIDNCKLRSLSQEISWNAENFYMTFLYAMQDASIVSICESSYYTLIKDWKRFISNVIENPSIEKILNGLDPSSFVIKNLICSTEKIEETIAILCLLSTTKKNKLKALDESYKSLDLKLANDELTKNDLNNIYRIFSILAIDFNKSVPTHPEQLIELGNKLIELAVPDDEDNENKDDDQEQSTAKKVVGDKEFEERRLKIKYCRDLLKILYYVPEEPLIDLSLGSRAVPLPVVIERPLPGEMQVQLVPRDPTPSVDILKGLASVLKRFALNEQIV
ncbi:hypothetical protein M9Y10_004357 [Tritrichomonas musculus]|uniref:FERM domain-containing protein n=1 Tax=Tritrichomonas musculus TaxID=1915356 RepID=A0ABR2JT32_9EUKA